MMGTFLLRSAVNLPFSVCLEHRKIVTEVFRRMCMRGAEFVSSNLSTIYALSSGHGKCGVAVIRVSGPHTTDVLTEVGHFTTLPKPREAILRHIRDPRTKDIIDRGIVLWFPGPRSFTGEDSCELQVHGGPAVVSAVLTALSKVPGCRPAEQGEFTKRAFYAGKMDLTAVDGLSDLIHAETEAQRKLALVQMEGALSKLYSGWRETILKNVAHVEAYIDFSEDQNIDGGILSKVETQVAGLKNSIQNHLEDGRCGERLRGGVRTAIVGEPNVGKSSLLNMLCQKNVAIVNPLAGTTRDVMERPTNIKGFPVLLADTAGLRKSTNVVEQEGIRRAHVFAKTADIALLVLDATLVRCRTEQFEAFVKECLQILQLPQGVWAKRDHKDTPRYVVVLNKTDLVRDKQYIESITAAYPDTVALSCKTECGMKPLLDIMTHHLSKMCGQTTALNPCITQPRYRKHLSDCVQCLGKFQKLVNGDVVLAAQQLHSAQGHLGKITGHVNAEEVLDVIFKEFCIGK